MSCRIRLDYLLDTFLGPIAKSVECEALIIPITPPFKFRCKPLSRMTFLRRIR
ncbi:hypothetical protein PS854_01529 [Pseudomonas fluorescens]|uniref:Uncharacterized protein n=1 Tax=Pseudomonas fluorescens TaxID=294 RepID=A0A5E7IFL8_PSEFL|nr:hypothetical protein PS854_01529 [Pseudomonas fluorescens]